MDIQKLREIFDRSGSFAVIVGSNYTIDEMGSALSIYLALSSQNKNVSIVSTKEPLVEVSNLVGIDKVKPSIEADGGDLIVSFPYKDDEIGKVSYTLEAGFLNIIVKPKEDTLSFGENDVLFKRTGGAPAVIITVGVQRLSELSSYFDINSLKDTTIVNIDKIGNNEGFGDIVLIGQGASSVSEQTANILLSLAMPMNPDISQNLMSGIVAATQDFQSSGTSSLAFEMAGILLRNGAIRESIKPDRRTQRYTSISQPMPDPYYNQPYNDPLDDNFPPMPAMPSVSAMPMPRRNQGMSQPSMPQRPLRTQTPNVIANSSQMPSSAPAQAIPTNSSQSELPSEQKKDEAPPDWLSPKIYKGSTNVE